MFCQELGPFHTPRLAGLQLSAALRELTGKSVQAATGDATVSGGNRDLSDFSSFGEWLMKFIKQAAGWEIT